MGTGLFDRLETLPEGVWLDRAVHGASERARQLDLIAAVLAAAPPFRPRMRNGTPFRHDISNCGMFGWISDERGYRYEPRHPVTGAPWPAIPDALREAASAAAARAGVPGFEPDACLINLYGADGRMGLHQDRDEADFSWPIVSFSFGANAVFALGGLARRDPVTRFPLAPGDVLVLHGPARLRFHGVDRLKAGGDVPHPVIPPGGRINLTFRRAA